MGLTFSQKILHLECSEMSLARRSLLYFTLTTKPDYEVNWHHRIMCNTLDIFLDPNSGLDRLIIQSPPRSGKSELTSRRFPAYALGKYPDMEIVLASYASPLAQRMNRDVQRIIDDDVYRKIFPNTKLSGINVKTDSHSNWIRTADLFEVVDHSGSFKSTGVGGGLTGVGADVAIVDDPIKDMKEAMSKTVKDSLFEWYQSVFYTRLSKHGKILIMSTRWSEDDLAGRLLDLARSDKDADQWKVLSFPMVQERNEYTHELDPREDGEVLWPNKFPPKKVKSIKISAGTKVWAALFQQRPAPSEGNLVNREWWRFYHVMPELSFFDYISMSWDFTFKGTSKSDFVVGQVWGRKGANCYLLDQVRDKMEFTETLQAIRTLHAKWPKVREIIVEEAANGAAIINVLKKSIRGIIPYKPRESKEARASSVSPQIEAGNIYLPDPKLAHWVHDYIEEWAIFPNGTNDDQVDTTTQMLIRFAKSRSWLEVLSEEENEETDKEMEIIKSLFGFTGIKNSVLNF